MPEVQTCKGLQRENSSCKGSEAAKSPECPTKRRPGSRGRDWGDGGPRGTAGGGPKGGALGQGVSTRLASRRTLNFQKHYEKPDGKQESNVTWLPFRL